jgi:hypothetical protein
MSSIQGEDVLLVYTKELYLAKQESYQRHCEDFHNEWFCILNKRASHVCHPREFARSRLNRILGNISFRHYRLIYGSDDATQGVGENHFFGTQDVRTRDVLLNCLILCIA